MKSRNRWHSFSAAVSGAAYTVRTQHNTRIELAEYDAGRFLSGMRRHGPWSNAEQVAVYGQAPAALLGVAHVYSGELIPDRLLSPIEIEQTLVQQHAVHCMQAQLAAQDR